MDVLGLVLYVLIKIGKLLLCVCCLEMCYYRYFDASRFEDLCGHYLREVNTIKQKDKPKWT